MNTSDLDTVNELIDAERQMRIALVHKEKQLVSELTPIVNRYNKIANLLKILETEKDKLSDKIKAEMEIFGTRTMDFGEYECTVNYTHKCKLTIPQARIAGVTKLEEKIDLVALKAKVQLGMIEQDKAYTSIPVLKVKVKEE
jgi:hypothetical protein